MLDALIVLANLMDSEGNLNNESAARLTEAVRLMNDGKSRCLVFCGWDYRTDSSFPIAEAFKRHAVQRLAVPVEKIETELLSRDTVGDAVFTKLRLANPRQWQDIGVVTSQYHVARTKEVFSFVYGRSVHVYGAPSDEGKELMEHELASIAAFRRTFDGIGAGDDEQILARLLSSHPFYNGQAHPALLASHVV